MSPFFTSLGYEGIIMIVIDKFMTIFDGLQEAYGTFKIENTGANGKTKGKRD